MNTKKILFSTLIALASVSAISTIVIAAVTMIPDAAPNPAVGTMNTLKDIYERITTGTTAVGHTLNPTLGPTTGTMYTLEAIYNAIPTNDKVLYGTNSGTANTPPGSGDAAIATDIITGHYAFNAAGTAIPGSASAGVADLVWSAAVPGLCWDTDPGNVWNTVGAGGPYCNTTNLGGWLTTPLGTPVGAVEYCKYLNTAGTALTDSIGIWELPTESELLAGLSDQFILGLPSQTGFQDEFNYWSGNDNDIFAWFAYISSTSVANISGNKFYHYIYTRCVH